MSAGEIVAIITAAGALITGVISIIVSGLTSKAAARKDAITSLNETIEQLQHENQRLWLRIQEYEGKIASLEKTINERDSRIRVLEDSLRGATQSRADREQRITELERDVGLLQGRINTLENGKAEL